MQPTAFAIALQPKLVTTLEAFDALMTPEIFSPSTASSTFTFACTDFEQVSLLPAVLANIRKLAPNLKIAIKNLELDNLATDLKNGDIDLAITNPSLAPSRYPCDTLYQEHYTCVMSSLSKQMIDAMTVAQVAQMPQVVVSPSRGDFSGAIHHWFTAKGYPRKVVMTFPTFSAAIAAIHSSDLCGFIPSALLPHHKLRPIDMKEAPPGFNVISVWHHRLSNDPLTQWIRNLLLSATTHRQTTATT
jgi:DNA-binding transcriptional LysR family regulator